MTDFLYELSHSWGDTPKQKAREKEYNQEYYQKNKEKWKTKYRKDRYNDALDSERSLSDQLDELRSAEDKVAYPLLWSKHGLVRDPENVDKEVKTLQKILGDNYVVKANNGRLYSMKKSDIAKNQKEAQALNEIRKEKNRVENRLANASEERTKISKQIVKQMFRDEISSKHDISIGDLEKSADKRKQKVLENNKKKKQYMDEIKAEQAKKNRPAAIKAREFVDGTVEQAAENFKKAGKTISAGANFIKTFLVG